MHDPDEDELDEDVKEGDEDENAVVGGKTYNEDENALSSPGDKSSDPIIPFILMGRRIIRRFRRRRGRGRRGFRFRRFRRRSRGRTCYELVDSKSRYSHNYRDHVITK